MQARVLIVDDNPVVRKTLRHLLEDNEGWEISEAEDGQRGVARALELRPNVVILDLVMPVMDGLNAAREISRALPDTAIVMYTMHWAPLLEVEAQKVGVRKLVSKAQSDVLRSVVQELLTPLPSSGPQASSPIASMPRSEPIPASPDSALTAGEKASTLATDVPNAPNTKLAG